MRLTDKQRAISWSMEKQHKSWICCLPHEYLSKHQSQTRFSSIAVHRLDSKKAQTGF